jgi:hypothetical protein
MDPSMIEIKYTISIEKSGNDIIGILKGIDDNSTGALIAMWKSLIGTKSLSLKDIVNKVQVKSHDNKILVDADL